MRGIRRHIQDRRKFTRFESRLTLPRVEARISAAIKAHVEETGAVPTTQEVAKRLAKRLAKDLPPADDKAA